jgi:hypothetical protein
MKKVENETETFVWLIPIKCAVCGKRVWQTYSAPLPSCPDSQVQGCLPCAIGLWAQAKCPEAEEKRLTLEAEADKRKWGLKKGSSLVSFGRAAVIVGLLAGSFLGFLFRPSAPLVGQLPFKVVMSLGWEAEGQRAGFCTETEGSALGLLKLPD